MKENVLVIGGASFIGSHLSEALLSAGHNVRILDDFSTGSKENIEDFADGTEIFSGDARNESLLARALKGQTALFHLAAKHGGRGYIESHEMECFSNVGLDNLVFQQAARSQVEKIIYASSACVYPVHLQEEPCLLRESDVSWRRPGGALADGAYGWAKLLGEMQLDAIKREYGISGISARIFTVYGERGNLTHALPALLARAICKEDPYAIWGDGRQTRNFTYVKDTVQGLLHSLSYLEEGGESAINVGQEKDFSIRDLVEEIFTLLDWRPEEIKYMKDAPVGVRYRASDNSLIKKIFSWQPETSLQEGLEKTLTYLEKNRSSWQGDIS